MQVTCTAGVHLRKHLLHNAHGWLGRAGLARTSALTAATYRHQERLAPLICAASAPIASLQIQARPTHLQPAANRHLLHKAHGRLGRAGLARASALTAAHLQPAGNRRQTSRSCWRTSQSFTRLHHRTAFSMSSIAPLFFTMAQNLDLRCVLISDPSTLGAGAKTRLESRIKKFTPRCICRFVSPGRVPRGPAPSIQVRCQCVLLV